MLHIRIYLSKALRLNQIHSFTIVYGYMTNTIDEYDVLVYPGFLRRNVAKGTDGSFAPLVRARGYKGDTGFATKTSEADCDITEIEATSVSMGKN